MSATTGQVAGGASQEYPTWYLPTQNNNEKFVEVL